MLCERVVIALCHPAADQGIVHAFVQATNSPAVVSLLVNFEIGSEKRFRLKLFDRETDGIRGVRKTSIPLVYTLVASISNCG